LFFRLLGDCSARVIASAGLLVQINQDQLTNVLSLDCRIQQLFSGFGNPLEANV